MANNQEQAIFDIDTAPVIFEILKKYNLQESEDEAVEKLEKGIPLQAETVLHIAEDAVSGKISEASVLSLLQKDLKISLQTAQAMAKDVKDKLISFARKATAEEIALLESEAEAEKTPTTAKPSPAYEPMPVLEPLPLKETPAMEKPMPQAPEKPAEKKKDKYTEGI